jgi:hypothetical protein
MAVKKGEGLVPESGWRVLDEQATELAEYGKTRLDGKVAYLATIKEDGRPRAHPVTPIIGEGHCFLFMEPTSPKANDLIDNGWYCLHCSMSNSSGSSGEFQMSGDASLVEDQSLRSLADELSIFKHSDRFLLFELNVREAMSKSYRGGHPYRQWWPAQDS